MKTKYISVILLALACTLAITGCVTKNSPPPRHATSGSNGSVAPSKNPPRVFVFRGGYGAGTIGQGQYADPFGLGGSGPTYGNPYR